jgi:ABC-type multidrug transport system ATPase subunit
LLVLDEPTTGVDAVSRSEFWEMLQKLRKLGITILVSTPYMDEASMCTRVALLQKGTVLDIASPADIVDGFRGILFGVSGANMHQLIKNCRCFKGVDSVFPFGEELHLTFTNGGDMSTELMAFLQSKGHMNVVIRRIAPNIEDRFMALMVPGTEKAERL